MKQLLRKLLRDIRMARGQFIAITVVIAIGATFLVGLSAVGQSMDSAVQAEYRAQRLADVWVYANGVDAAGLQALRSLPGVAAADGRLRLSGELDSAGRTGSFLIVAPPQNPSVNVPRVTQGRMPRETDECMVDGAYAKANGIRPGSRLPVTIGGRHYEFTVRGIFESAEFIYAVKDAADPVPDHKTYGELFLSPAFGQSFAGGRQNEILLRTDGKTDAQSVLDAAARQVKPYGFVSGFLRKNDMSVTTVQSKVDAVKKISAVFPVIFFLVAALITFISMSRQIESQRTQIAVLKALGARNRELRLFFLLYPVIAALAGSGVGILLGVTLIPPVIFRTFSKLFVLPGLSLRGFGPQAAAAVLLSLLFGTAATWLSARGPLKENPAQAMRPKAPASMRPLLAERWTALWRKLPGQARLILRNVGRGKARTILSSIGIVGCVGLTVTAVGMKHASLFIMDDQFQRVDRYQLSASLNVPEESAAAFSVSVPNIRRAEKSAAVLVSLPDRSGTDSVRLMLFNEGQRAVSIEDTAGRTLALPADGVVVSQKYAWENGIRAGGTLDLTVTSASGSRTVAVRVAGICRLYTAQRMYASFSYMRSLGLDVPADTVYFTVRPGADAARAAASLRGDSRLGSVTTKAGEFRNYQTAMQSLDTIILLMVCASAALALTVIYNISSINIFERRRDLATLKVLGSYRGEVRGLVFRENLIITAVGSVFGIGFGLLLYEKLIGPIAPAQMMFPTDPGWYTVPVSVLLGFAFTLLANFLLRRQVDGIDMVESLKSVE